MTKGEGDYRARLIAARERLGLTRIEMSERLLTPHRTYDNWEEGKQVIPGVAVIAAEGLRVRLRAKQERDRERNAEITRRMVKGDSLAAIIGDTHLSKARIYQIAKAAEAVASYRADKQAPIYSTIRRMADGTWTYREIGVATDRQPGTIKSIVAHLRREGEDLRIRDRRSENRGYGFWKKYPEEIIDRAVAMVRAGSSVNRAAATVTNRERGPIAVVSRVARRCDEMGIVRQRRK